MTLYARATVNLKFNPDPLPLVPAAIMFQYYIKIVPTLLEKENGETVFTNQFSVTKYQKAVSPATGESGMPGVFFNYELSPLMVKYTERKK